MHIWMCGVTRRDNIRNEHIRGTTRVVQASQKIAKTAEVVRPCVENERGAQREKNARCGHTREKKKRAAKHKMERCM